MVRRPLVPLVLLAAAAAAPAAEGPTYAPVEAALLRPRGGLANVLARLEAGKEVRVAYLGGSITAQRGWRVKTLAWFRETWPQAKIVEINAAIGGTGSDLGVFRLRRDALRHRPHLLFVEFAVNDGGRDPRTIWRAMEGIARQTWAQDANTDICYVYTIHTRGMPKDYARGVCPRSASSMEMLAEHYGIPSINVGLRIVQLHEAGKLIYKPELDANTGKPLPVPEGKMCFANDDCHPRDEGHEIYTDVITDALARLAGVGEPGPHRMPEPFVADHWQAARLEEITADMLSDGWRKLPDDKGLGKRFGSRFPALWQAETPGESIAFRFRGSLVRLYDLVGPDGGQAVLTVDGKTRGKPRPRFDKYCTYHRIAVLSVAAGLDPNEVHDVKVTIHPEQPDRSAVLDRVRDHPRFDPKRYDGTVLRVGGILLLGELVPSDR